MQCRSLALGYRVVLGLGLAVASSIALLATTITVGIAEDKSAGLERFFPKTAQLERVWSDGVFTEGPAYGPDHCVYFSDIGNRIMKFDPATGKTVVYREPSGKANGLCFDKLGRLVACEGANGGNRRVSMTEKDGTICVLADRWMGRRFNSPNDLDIDAQNRIYFSDPRYVGDEPRELNREAVYRIDPNGKVVQLITDVEKPNGVAVSPDGKTLYVADTNPAPGGARLLLAYALDSNGDVGPRKVLYDFGKEWGIDGMCLDEEGNIYAAAGSGAKGGIYIFSSQGKLLAFLRTPESPSNCTFGDRDRKTLYITAGKSLYRIRTNVRGYAVYWPADK